MNFDIQPVKKKIVLALGIPALIGVLLFIALTVMNPTGDSGFYIFFPLPFYTLTCPFSFSPCSPGFIPLGLLLDVGIIASLYLLLSFFMPRKG